MRKWKKIILIVLLIAMAFTLFVACKKRGADNLSVTFVSNDEEYAKAGNIEQVKKVFEDQPVREGYVFKGWYLDKGIWQQEIASENVQEIIKNGDNINVYAYWVEIVNKITVSFRDYSGAILLEKDYERTDDQLEKDINVLKPSKRPDDDMYTYTFDKWSCDTSDLTQGYYLATPIYNSELRYFDIKYYVEGKLLYTDKVKYGEDADLNLLETPQKQSTEKYEYTFIGWEGNTTNITSDTVLNAKFREDVKKFNVIFNCGNNKIVTRKVQYGESAVAPSSNEVAKSSTPQTDFIFIGWDNAFDNVRQNIVVNAKYAEQTRMYEVRFWIDNTCVKYLNVPYGSRAEAPSQPVKITDDGFTYEFKSWDVSYDFITSNLDVRARFDRVSHTYTIEYVNWDGSFLWSEQVSSGQPSTYGGETPTRQANDKAEYIFSGWTDEDKLGAVTRNMTVKAVYTEKVKTFKVVFNYGDDKRKQLNNIAYGTDLTYSNLVPIDVEKASTQQYDYLFVGWDGTFNNITSDVVINAKYSQQLRSYEVKFYVDDECIKSVSALYGSSVEAPQAVKVTNDGYTYEFIEWDKAFDNIIEDTYVYARFDKISHTYKVQYINWDGKLLYTDDVLTGEASTYGGETPVREANDRYTYEFAGWTNSEALNSVTQSFATQAVFVEIERTYTVTFNYGHGLKKVIEGVPYGTDLRTDVTLSSKIPTDTDKSSTKQYDFTFIDWDKYFGYVSTDMEINAIYKETIRRYIVQFINNGVAILTQEIEYGKYPTLPTGNTIKNDTLKWAFDFLGWKVLEVDTTVAGGESDIDPDDGTDYRYTVANADGFELSDPENSIVEDTITYTAIYSRTIQQYVVKFFNEENDKETLKEITVPWGTNVLTSEIESYQAPTPFKQSVPKWDYEFVEWIGGNLTKVQANISVYADYLAKIRSYWVTYMNGDVEVAKYYVEYDSVSPRPEEIPAKVSTLEYDFEFEDWDRAADRVVEGELTINAVYKNNLRSYIVTLFNLATRELISTGEFAYGTKITTTISVNGYDFDSWYRDPDCNTVFNQEEERVDGPMMLFGNIVMKGLQFNGNNEIIGYEGVEGAQTNLIIPIAANGRKVSIIKKEAFKDNKCIGSVYIPNTITCVENYAFANLDLSETGGIYVQASKAWTGTPSGWKAEWNWNSAISSDISKKRPINYGVNGVYTVGDYQYMLFADGTAYVDKFINNTISTAYIDDEFVHELASFTSTVWKDTGKTEETRDIYDVAYNATTYSITQISVSAFEGCKNITTVFIPSTISKVGNYAFSGVTANIYIAKEKPTTTANAKYGWGLYWNSNRNGQDGERNAQWDVIAMDSVGDYNYIFKTKGVAIAAEYLGNKAIKTSLEVPGKVTYKDEEYTVEELGDELLANMSLLNTVTIGEGVKKIGSKVFYMDIMLKTVNLPSSLEEIGGQAFMACMALNEIYIPANVSKIGSLAFIGIDNLTIYCGNKKTLGVAPVGYILGWNTKLGFSDLGNLTDISGIVGSITQTHEVIWDVAGLPQTDSVGSALPGAYKYLLYNDGHAELIEANVPVGSLNTSYSMPSSITYNGVEYAVTTIKANAFAGNTRIKELIIPTSVTNIEANAFQGCSNLTIKTAYTAETKPSGWDSNFNADVKNVEWGYEVNASVDITGDAA